ncbi:hypothetical protein FB45DRAFT_897246 [Roridomyces roridus]|uniref:G-patch domain-containing protein n=1 Tax=Roridomyces roridus TaxID=1738132 RepID=A0AAD7CBG5_9AGAR|nr:hypothetical protein FB45DRAFT_897246 [Roridomyces roridus]
MATTAFTIYSHYDPADRERLERETGQIPDEQALDPSEAWEAEANATFKRKLAPPPRFVPAGSAIPSPAASTSSSKSSSDVASWYKSLTETTSVTRPVHVSAGSSTRAARIPETQRNKNNWFIMKAITTEPTITTTATPSTLADILARDPPPLPHEQQYSPPVWLAIGPTNKGFEMLQNSGWSEGEALGVGSGPRLKKEVTDEVIDLTVSDSEDEDEAIATSPDMEADRKALVTPLATVLKSDRLGIGLKAKTTGPYRASQKRITHNAAAMLAHTKAAEESRKQKHTNGRGHRAFARQRKAEEATRRRQLAYMNEQ